MDVKTFNRQFEESGVTSPGVSTVRRPWVALSL